MKDAGAVFSLSRSKENSPELARILCHKYEQFLVCSRGEHAHRAIVIRSANRGVCAKSLAELMPHLFPVFFRGGDSAICSHKNPRRLATRRLPPPRRLRKCASTAFFVCSVSFKHFLEDIVIEQSLKLLNFVVFSASQKKGCNMRNIEGSGAI